MLTLEHEWTWDFWLADDGERYHVFYLHAPMSLGDERRRHRAARIGHATSRDLVQWSVVGDVFTAGSPGSFDETATWTGSVVRGDDGLWRMFYTGARFLDDFPAQANIESIGVATSADLMTWEKQTGPVLTADPRWYETLGTSSWPEEAWRDPWVYRDPDDRRWHMLITARANEGPDDERGVIGHAVSDDLSNWATLPPLTAPGNGFQHMEVPQIVDLEPDRVLLFSCSTGALSRAGLAAHREGGVWAARISGDAATAGLDPVLLSPERMYSGKLIRDRRGTWQFLAFLDKDEQGDLIGRIADPLPVDIVDGLPVIREPAQTL